MGTLGLNAKQQGTGQPVHGRALCEARACLSKMELVERSGKMSIPSNTAARESGITLLRPTGSVFSDPNFKARRCKVPGYFPYWAQLW